jgi:hypothetical protein
MDGFAANTPPYVPLFPADDDFNAGHPRPHGRIVPTGLRHRLRTRFISGGTTHGCPWLKIVPVRTAAFAPQHLARLRPAIRPAASPVFPPRNRSHRD